MTVATASEVARLFLQERLREGTLHHLSEVINSGSCLVIIEHRHDDTPDTPDIVCIC